MLGHIATGEKSNEITTIPQVLNLIDIKGDMFTIDAMGCQTVIVQQIRKKEANYVLTIKEDQLIFYQNIRDYCDFLEEKPCLDRPTNH